MPKQSKFASVIVLNWNGKRFLEKCIGSLLSQNYQDYEVVLVDNGSTDGSIEFAEKLFGRSSRLRVVSFNKNYGFSKGNNLAIKMCTKSDYVIILNNDTEVEKNFIKELVNAAENDESIGSVGCKILTPDKKIWFSQKFTNHGLIVPYFLQTLIEKRIENISNTFNTNLSNSGCAVLYRKDVLDKIGGFDEDFWSNWEDWDLGYRTNIAGFKSVSIPEPLVYHVGGGSEGSSPDRCFRIYRNELFTYFKNYDLRNLLIRFPFHLLFLLPTYHVCWFLNRLITRPPEFYKGREPQYFFSLGKAILDFLLRLRIFVGKRYFIQDLRKVSDKEIFANTQRNSIL